MIHIAGELFGDEEARPRDHPVIGIAIEEDAARGRGFDRRGVGKEEMTPAEHRARGIEGDAMLLQIGPLDEIAAILLFDRHEHADDVAQQMTAAFRNAVQEHRLAQRRLREAADLGVQRVGFHHNFGSALNTFLLRTTTGAAWLPHSPPLTLYKYTKISLD